MRRILLLLMVIRLVACGGAESPEEAAMKAAEEYYNGLKDGDYEAFLAGRADMEGMPASFNEQLLVVYKQFVRQQEEAHVGITSFTASRAQMDSALQMMQVFLMVNYADSTQEEIVVPMVERQGEWKMK